jgi:hypothetical protein
MTSFAGQTLKNKHSKVSTPADTTMFFSKSPYSDEEVKEGYKGELI